MAAGVHVQPRILEWAQARRGLDHSAMRQRFRQWDRWLAEEAQPTMRQAQDLAEFTRIPFGMLFLEAPPEQELPIPDFRVTGQARQEPSQELLETIYLNQRRQGWFEDYVAVWGEAPADFPRAARGMTVGDAARLIRESLGYELPQRSRLQSFDAVRKYLARAFEARGGLVVMSSMVGNNTHRMLDRDEFRGFTLQSPTVPLVFINANDTKSGQIFSLLHEFAHVWRGDTGVSVGGDPMEEAKTGVERWCDEVAAEVAVPASDLAARFRPAEPLTEELDRLAMFYKISTLVVLIRLRDLGLVVSGRDFDAMYQEELDRLMELIEGRRNASGGDFYNNQPFRIGERLSQAIIADVRSGATSMTEALRLMSLGSSAVFDKYAARVERA